MFRRFFCTSVAVAALGIVLLPQSTFAQEEITPEQTPPVADVQTDTPPAASADYIELHRLRFVNRKDGPIQVSTDQGKTWQLIGRVTTPATTTAGGYAAAEYAKPGSVAAVSVYGHRLRVSAPGATQGWPFILAIEPAEYGNHADPTGRESRQGFGGFVSGASGLFTDIPAGTSLFRELAPLVGNIAYLEGPGGGLMDLPKNFTPSGTGEVLIIPVKAPAQSLTQITIENKTDGEVRGTFADGTEKLLTRVAQPVRGIGRFDGTSYTGTGRVNTAHTGVITISTAPLDRSKPEYKGKEGRGGFQITPAWHNARTEEAGAPMVLVIGPTNPRRKVLEGQAPLFSDYIGLDDLQSARTDVSIDGGAWEPMVPLVGLQLDGFTGPGLTRAFKGQKSSRTSLDGVTGFRITLPARTHRRSELFAADASAFYTRVRLAAAKKGNTPIVSGRLTINANPTNSTGVSFVRLMIEGKPRGFTNVAPFALTWDTRTVDNGDYLLEAEALSENGVVIATTRRRVFVNNPAAPKANKTQVGTRD